MIPREAPNASGYFKFRWEETDLGKGIVETYTTDNKFHVNWGYNGLYDGLYESMIYKDVDGIEHNFDYNKSVIVNIK